VNHDPATHVSIDRCDLSDAAFWLGQLARWLDDPNHASQFSWDLFNVPEDYRPPLTVVIAGITEHSSPPYRWGQIKPTPRGQMNLTQATDSSSLITELFTRSTASRGSASPSSSATDREYSVLSFTAVTLHSLLVPVRQ
jgi:hypothetical protein